MWLEAILSRDDLQQAVAHLAPVTIDLGSEGAALYIGAPNDVALIANEGLHITCPAKLGWPVLGISVPVVINEVSFMLTPRIEQKDGVEQLVFEPRIEKADFAMLPNMIDRRVTDLVNKELDARRQDLAWNFRKTLQLSFELPAAMSPRRTMSLTAQGAMVRVTEEAVVLAVCMKAIMSEVAPRDAAIPLQGGA